MLLVPGKNDDYEDIAIVGDMAYVLRSDGTIFKVENFKEKRKIKTTKIVTSLNIKNNTEGLFFHKSTNSLFIACKGSPSINEKEVYEGFKAIYRFDLKNNKLIEKPVYLVDLYKTDSFKYTGIIEKFFIETAAKLKLTVDDNSFHPSGIAIHPIDKGDMFISNEGKNGSGNILRFKPKKTFKKRRNNCKNICRLVNIN